MTLRGARIALLGFGLFLGLGMAEIGLRLYSRSVPGGLGPPKLRIQYLQRSSVPELGFETRPGFVLHGTEDHNLGVEVAFNRLGFRGPEADADALEAGRGGDELLIAILGDSYTLGSSVPLEATFAKLTETHLRERGYRVRVLNLGTGSYNSQQEAAYLESKLLGRGRTPDILVWQFLLNDVWEGAHYRDYAERPTFLERHSLVAWLLGSTARRLRADDRDWRVNLPKDYPGIQDLMLRLYSEPERLEFLETHLSRANAALAEHDVPNVFLYIPYHEMLEDWSQHGEALQALDARVLEIAARAGWSDRVTTTEAEKRYPFLDLILDLERDHHPNVLGHRVIAGVLSDHLEARLQADPQRFGRFSLGDSDSRVDLR